MEALIRKSDAALHTFQTRMQTEWTRAALDSFHASQPTATYPAALPPSPLSVSGIRQWAAPFPVLFVPVAASFATRLFHFNFVDVPLHLLPFANLNHHLLVVVLQNTTPQAVPAEDPTWVVWGAVPIVRLLHEHLSSETDGEPRSFASRKEALFQPMRLMRNQCLSLRAFHHLRLTPPASLPGFRLPGSPPPVLPSSSEPLSLDEVEQACVHRLRLYLKPFSPDTHALPSADNPRAQFLDHVSFLLVGALVRTHLVFLRKRWIQCERQLHLERLFSAPIPHRSSFYKGDVITDPGAFHLLPFMRNGDFFVTLEGGFVHCRSKALVAAVVVPEILQHALRTFHVKTTDLDERLQTLVFPFLQKRVETVLNACTHHAFQHKHTRLLASLKTVAHHATPMASRGLVDDLEDLEKALPACMRDFFQRTFHDGERMKHEERLLFHHYVLKLGMPVDYFIEKAKKRWPVEDAGRRKTIQDSIRYEAKRMEEKPDEDYTSCKRMQACHKCPFMEQTYYEGMCMRQKNEDGTYTRCDCASCKAKWACKQNGQLLVHAVQGVMPPPPTLPFYNPLTFSLSVRKLQRFGIPAESPPPDVFAALGAGASAAAASAPARRPPIQPKLEPEEEDDVAMMELI